MKKPLTPDEIVDRALKRLPKVPLEVLDEEFQPRTSTKNLWGYDWQIRVALHQRKIFWQFELQKHLLFKGTLNGCARWEHWKWSRFFLSEKACVRAAHLQMDEFDAPTTPLTKEPLGGRLLGDVSQRAEEVK